MPPVELSLLPTGPLSLEPEGGAEKPEASTGRANRNRSSITSMKGNYEKYQSAMSSRRKRG